jgi:hypothetical protein
MAVKCPGRRPVNPGGRRRLGQELFEPASQDRQLSALGDVNVPVQLEDHRAVHAEPLFGGIEQASVETEAVAPRIERLVRLVREIGIAKAIRLWQIGEVGDDQVEVRRNRLEEVSLHDVDAIGDAEPASIGAGDEDRRGADVACPDLRRGGEASQADGDRTRAGADVGDARVPPTDALGRRGDELFGRATRRHYSTRSRQQR